jgi:Flp pilus assembly pilin Flp
MLALIRRFAEAGTGATSFEYGLIAAGIAIAISVVVGIHGAELIPVLEKMKIQLATQAHSLANPRPQAAVRP